MDFLFYFLNSEQLNIELESERIKPYFVSWLHLLLNNWMDKSCLGIAMKWFDNFPDLDLFQEDQYVLLRNLRDASEALSTEFNRAGVTDELKSMNQVKRALITYPKTEDTLDLNVNLTNEVLRNYNTYFDLDRIEIQGKNTDREVINLSFDDSDRGSFIDNILDNRKYKN